jgi:aspartate aminotransferase-like enzyme
MLRESSDTVAGAEEASQKIKKDGTEARKAQQRKRNEALRKRGKPAGGAPNAVSRTDSVDEIGDASEC